MARKKVTKLERETPPLERLRDEFHALLADLVPAARWSYGSQPTSPAVDVRDRGDSVEIRVDLLGFRPDQLAVEVEGEMLRLFGYRRVEREEQAGAGRWHERRRRRFLRGIQLPEMLAPETVEASYKGGLLTITVGKRPPAPGAAKPARKP